MIVCPEENLRNQKQAVLYTKMDAIFQEKRLNLFEAALNATGAEKIIMDSQYTALIKRDGNWWIGWIEEIPGVNCQERTRDELLKSLKLTLQEALALNRKDALEAAGTDYKEESIAP